MHLCLWMRLIFLFCNVLLMLYYQGQCPHEINWETFPLFHLILVNYIFRLWKSFEIFWIRNKILVFLLILLLKIYMYWIILKICICCFQNETNIYIIISKTYVYNLKIIRPLPRYLQYRVKKYNITSIIMCFMCPYKITSLSRKLLLWILFFFFCILRQYIVVFFL